MVNIATDQLRYLSIQLALAKKLLCLMLSKNYHKQTKIANSKSNLTNLICYIALKTNKQTKNTINYDERQQHKIIRYTDDML